MIDLAVLTYVLVRQFWIPIVVVVGGVWGWTHYADSSLVPDNKYTRQIQSVIYQAKYHPIARMIKDYVFDPDFIEDVHNLSLTTKNATGLDKVNAIDALGLLEGNSSTALPILVWTLYDQNPEVRRAAVRAINMIAPPEIIRANKAVVPMLQKLLNSSDVSVQKTARNILGANKMPSISQDNLGPLKHYMK
jgi:hypothetical protein